MLKVSRNIYNRAINQDGTSIDFLLTARRNIQAAQCFFRKAFKEDRPFAPTQISTDKASPFPKIIQTMKQARKRADCRELVKLLASLNNAFHNVSK